MLNRINIITTIEKTYAYTVLTMCAVVMFIALYWLFIQDDKIITDIKPIITTNNPDNVVEVGHTLSVVRSYCLNTNKYLGKAERSFADHVVFSVPETTVLNSLTGLGCQDRTFLIEIPMVLPSGEYDYTTKLNYRLNPLRVVQYDLPTIKVKVVNPVWDDAQKRMLKDKKK